jgi:flavin reductase (DIM6/NTAB) family NADH-FMN oxidoreductase RutF
MSEARFRDVIGRFASGVTVITTSDGVNLYGTTANAISSVSADPPMLLACLNENSTTQAAIRSSGRFAVNILSADQAELARGFAGKGPAKFDGVPLVQGADSLPVVDGALAVISCTVADAIRAGTHAIFIANVVDAEARDGEPLTYFRGAFGRLAR